EPNWDAAKPVTRSSRALMDDDGRLYGNRRVGEVFALAKLTDVAPYLAAERADYALLEPTGKIRADQFHVTPRLRSAIAGCWYDRHGLSDHAGVVLDLDMDGVAA